MTVICHCHTQQLQTFNNTKPTSTARGSPQVCGVTFVVLLHYAWNIKKGSLNRHKHKSIFHFKAISHACLKQYKSSSRIWHKESNRCGETVVQQLLQGYNYSHHQLGLVRVWRVTSPPLLKYKVTCSIGSFNTHSTVFTLLQFVLCQKLHYHPAAHCDEIKKLNYIIN